MQRREVLAALGITATAALAGCSGGGDGSDNESSDGTGNGSGDDGSETDNGDETGDSNGDETGDESGDETGDDNGDDEDAVPEYDIQEAIDALSDYIGAQELDTAESLRHSESSAQPTTLDELGAEIIQEDYTVLEENIDAARVEQLLGELESIDQGAIDTISQGVVVVIEATFVINFGDPDEEDSNDQSTQQWVLATENGEWRIVEQALGLN